MKTVTLDNGLVAKIEFDPVRRATSVQIRGVEVWCGSSGALGEIHAEGQIVPMYAGEEGLAKFRKAAETEVMLLASKIEMESRQMLELLGFLQNITPPIPWKPDGH
jgi:hypothetical protein